jgi:diacylglycerol kinase (ATP)
MGGPFELIVNPAAGRGRSLRVLAEASAALDAAGAAYHVAESASLDHARDLAARAAQQDHVVVAVGGDGLAGALAGAAAAARPGARYGIIPAGNGNDLARSLGLPSSAAAAVRVLTAGRERPTDLIAVAAADQPQVIVAGSVYLGIPAVAGEIANRTRWLRGPVVYPAAALRAVAGWAPAAFRVEIRGDRADGHPADDAAEPTAVHDFAGYAVVVANAPYFGAGMKVAPPAETDDGLLDVVIMRHGPRLAFLRALAKVKSGSHLGLPQISLDRGGEVTVTVGRDLPAGADGEPLPGATPLRSGIPLRVRALPGALRVLVSRPGGPAAELPGLSRVPVRQPRLAVPQPAAGPSPGSVA